MSEIAAHPASSGFELFSPDGLSQTGPFFDEKYLKAWIQELAKLVPHGSLVFIKLFDNEYIHLLDAKELFLDNIKPWVNEFMNSTSQQ